MKKISYLFIAIFSVLLLSRCEKDLGGTDELDFVTFENKTFDFGVDIDGTNERDILVYTTQIKNSDRSYNVVVDIDASTADPEAYHVPDQVVVPASSNEGKLSIQVSDLNIGDLGETLVIKLVEGEGYYISDPIVVNIRKICPLNEVVVSITFDDYASECTWELLDQNSDLIVSGGPWEDGKEFFTTNLCLEDGTYYFTVYDAWGDGLSSSNLGSVTLTHEGNTLVEIVGDFGSEAGQSFTL